MHIRRSLSFLLSTFVSVSLAFAGTNPHVASRPQPRITQTVDNTKLAPITNSHPAAVSKLADAGRLDAATQLSHMTLVLRGSDAQEFELHSLLDAQQDKTSPNFHQWMTPDTFGDSFGVDSSDLTKITAWLQASGLSVDSVAKSKRIIQFSGTAGNVEAAFHTELHQYLINNQTRIANATDISIPRAFSGVVGGVVMNNIRPTRNLQQLGLVRRGADGQLHRVDAGSQTTPYVTFGTSTNPVHYIGGGDLPILYNSQSLIAAGNDGTGVKIGILGQTDILLNDIQTYRTAFGIKPNNPNFVIIGQDPQTQADDGESDLDVEASGAMAPGATIDFYEASNNLYALSGVLGSAYYVIENNSDDIISLSYGEAEIDLGSDNALMEFLWEQAASQGISVFVSTGDSGSDTYDDGQSYARTASQQYSVSGFSSTPYNVAVGGTMMDETAAAGYWSPTNILPGNVSALGYIPEQPWNETSLGSFYSKYGGFGGIVAESSGISIIYGTPSWQTGPGVPTTDPTPIKGAVTGYTTSGPHRYQPDVALQAAAYDDGFLTCSEGSCVVGNDGSLEQAGIVAGTSIAAPSMAGVQALVDQKNGGRQGNPNYYYYRLAATQSSTACVSSAVPVNDKTSCSFHDIQAGNNYIPSKNGGSIANGNYVGWSAGPGFDMAIGLGSPDIANLANNWHTVTFNATTTTLSLTPTTTANVGTTINYTIKVAPASGAGTPTGDVSIIAQTTNPNGGVGYITLANGQASGTIPDGNTLSALPAGTYKVYAHYSGDTTYGGSNSPAVQVTIGQATSTPIITPYYVYYSTTYGLTINQQSAFTYGQNVYLDGQVCDPSGAAFSICSTGAPTGTLKYTLVNGSTSLTPLTTPLDATGHGYLLAGFGVGSWEFTPNYPVLPAGIYTVTAAYSGDGSFAASTSTPITITIGATATTTTLTANSSTIASGATATINASLATVAVTLPQVSGNGVLAPAGTLTFTDTTTSTALGTCTLSNGACVFTTTAITTSGAHTISAAFTSSDGNYTAAAKTVTITVGGSTAPTPTVSFTVGGTAATTASVGQSTVIVAAVASPATGTVSFFDGGVLLGTGTLSTSSHTASRTVTTFTAGTHTITAVYGGSSTLQSSNSAPVTFVVTKNSPLIQLQATGQSATNQTVSMLTQMEASPSDQAYSPTTGQYSAMNPAPTGTVSFLDNGTSIGTAAMVYFGGSGYYTAQFTTKALTPGVHTLTAQYPGDANYNASAASNSETFNIGLTNLSLTAPSTVGANVAFPMTVRVVPAVANTAAIGGTVTFSQGATVLGTATVVNGVATMPKTAVLAGLGAQTVTVSYSGDANYYKSSSAVTVNVVTSGFNLSLSQTSFTLGQNYSGMATVTATVTGYYTGTATLACSGMPTNAICRTLPAGLTFDGSGSAATTTLYIITGLNGQSAHSTGMASLLWIPAIFFAGLLLLRRRQLSARGRQIVTLAVLLCATMAGSGCGNAHSPYLSTPTGTSTVTVTATATGTGGSPNQTATTSFTLNVTN